MTDTSYIYGDSNGAWIENVKGGGKTHWDPRLEIKVIGGTVQLGIIPSSEDESTDLHGIWNNDDGQFIHLSRSGLNRLIRAARECRNSVYGKDE